jgi:adenylate cyclase
MSFFEELKRRNVLRVAIAYLAGGWLLIQIVETIFPAFGLGDFSVRVTVIVFAIGLIPTLIIAWAFELTPEGLKKDSDVERSQSFTPQTGKKLDRIIMLVLALALSYFVFDKFVVPTPPPISSGHSIAVLPFVNMSDDASNEYFSEGLSVELRSLLTRIPELKVVAEASSRFYKGKDINIVQIGKDLKVAHVLEGSVRKSGNEIRITAQLSKTHDGFHVWSQTYDRTLSDIFATQDEIAASVVAGLKVSILGAMPTQQETDPEVYRLYLQGEFFLDQRNDESLQKALATLKKALDIDPDYAPAWVALNVTYTYLTFNGTFERAEGIQLAHAAVDRALAIDGNMASAWAGRAYLLKTFDGDWAGAQAAIDRAMELDPNNRSVTSVAISLANTLGQFPEAIALLEKHVSLDPINLGGLSMLARAYTRAGRFDEAIEVADRMVLLNPNYANGLTALSRAYLLKGDPERALIELEKNPGFFNAAFKARLHFTLGNEAQSQAFIKELLADSPHQNPGRMASVYAWRGENDAAFEWLEMSFEKGMSFSSALGNEWGRGLENDPRYPILLEKVGLLEAWKAMPTEYRRPSKPQD